MLRYRIFRKHHKKKEGRQCHDGLGISDLISHELWRFPALHNEHRIAPINQNQSGTTETWLHVYDEIKVDVYNLQSKKCLL